MKKNINKILFLFFVFLFMSIEVKADSKVEQIDYSGTYKEYIVPKSGYYKIELWGASGGPHEKYTGRGGYTSGEIFLTKGKKLYFYVGNSTDNMNASFNGGGSCQKDCYSGGGATDVRYFGDDDPASSDLLWYSTLGLRSRIMVAAGGGGANIYAAGRTKGSEGGYGGGLVGRQGYGQGVDDGPYGGSQTAGGDINDSGPYRGTNGSFGRGGNGGQYGGGGGGGYYGGAAGGNQPSTGGGESAGAGGSSYISGYTGSVAITSSTDGTPKTGCADGTTNIACSYHYSGLFFHNPIMKNGGETMLNVNGDTVRGNLGNGHAKITFLSGADTLLNILVDNATLAPTFREETLEYEVEIPSDNFETNIHTTLKEDVIWVSGDGPVTLEKNHEHSIITMREDGEIVVYSLIPTLVKAKLTNIQFEETTFEFEKDIFKYNLEVASNVTSLTPIITKENGVEYEIISNPELYYGDNEIIIEARKSGLETTRYIFNVNRLFVEIPEPETFNPGNYGIFTAPQDGKYKVELWGASGGNHELSGKGAYTSGLIELTAGEQLYVYVGNYGSSYTAASYNGGGSCNQSCRGGGGSTDVRYFGDNVPADLSWGSTAGLRARIMVAGGGGGPNLYSSGSTGGYAGGLVGRKGYGRGVDDGPFGGSQLEGGNTNNTNSSQRGTDGSFGRGGNGGTYGGGGGGGYYGGGGGSNVPSSGGQESAGGGGSSYISGYLGSVAITSKDDATPKDGCRDGNPSLECSYHYSGKIFTHTVMRSGNEQMPSQTNSNVLQDGNMGHGFAKITYVATDYDEITMISADKGTFEPADFTVENHDYTLRLLPTESSVTLSATSKNHNGIILGTGLKEGITNAETNYPITLTQSDGSVEIYNVVISRIASDSVELAGIKINGKPLADFEEGKYEYNIVLPIETQKINIDLIKKFPSQIIEGQKIYDFLGSTLDATFMLTPEDDSGNQPYVFHFQREKKSLLKTLDITGGTLKEPFNPYKTEYTLLLRQSVRSVGVSATAYFETADITINGNKYVGPDATEITIDVDLNETGIPVTKYTLHIERIEESTDIEGYTFEYVEDYQTFIAPYYGDYTLEVWGAEGGGKHLDAEMGISGKGGYSKGTVRLQAGEKLYIFVGGQGSYCGGLPCTKAGGWNGGGSSIKYNNAPNDPVASGGGATDIRIFPSQPKSADLNWDATIGLNSRLIVAGGGGGGGVDNEAGGSGGGTNGLNGNGYRNASNAGGAGGTQTSGFAFGSGCNASSANGSNSTYGGPGGGGGWYGGRCSSYTGSGGGSGFVWTEATKGNVPASYTVDSKYYLRNAETIAGNTTMPNYEGTNTIVGNTGNGFAKITAKPIIEGDPYLDSILLDDGVVPLNFNPWTEEYELTVPKEKLTLNIKATPKASTSKVEGTGDVTVNSGENTYEILVTAKEGNTKTYTIKVTREKSEDANPTNIELKWTQSYLCDPSKGLCDYTFNPATDHYDILIPYGIENVTLNAILKTEHQTVQYYYYNAGVKTLTTNPTFALTNGVNKFEVAVTSEDEAHTNTYVYEITKDDTSNNYLDTLTITEPNIPFTFNPNTYEYYLTIPEGYSSYTVNATPQVEGVNINITGKTTGLTEGMNDCRITVTSKNNKQRSYILHVYKEKPTQIYLSSLVVKDKDNQVLALNPNFNRIITEYSMSVGEEIDKINVSASFESTPKTVTGLGEHTLVSGMNEITISAINDDDEISTTVIYVNKAKSSNSTLDNITITNHTLEPPYQKGLNEYKVVIGRDETSVQVNIEKPDTITTTIKGDTNLVNKNSDIIITSIAENNTFQIYTIHVEKEASTVNDLKSLTVSSGTLTQTANPSEGFNKNVISYQVEVESDIKNITIGGELEDENSSVTGLGTYALTSGSNNIFNIVVTSEAGVDKTYTITVTKKKDTDTSLDRIENNRGSVVKKIDDTHYQINVQYEVDSIEITGIPKSETTTVSGNGTYSLNTGNNEFKLTTTAEDTSIPKGEYFVQVVRDKSENDDASFIYVQEGGLSPSFNETTIHYDVKVDNTIDSLDKLHIDVELEDKKATYELIYKDTDHSLKDTKDTEEEVISKEVVVRVYAEKYKESKEKYKDYTIRVTRQPATTSNLDLISLTTSPTELTGFSSNVTNYELTIDYNVENLTVSATAADENMRVLGTGTYPMKVGKNLISVFVIDNDGVEKSYQIVVTRKKSNNANLKSLTIENVILNFDKDTTTYQITSSKDQLNFTSVIPEETGATYKIEGNENFGVGENTVTITVTAPDGETTKPYTITVTKEASGNNNLSLLEVVGYNLTPKFHKGVTYYTVEVENNVNTVEINATAEDSTVKSIEGTGIKNISVGTNTFEIVVTSAKDTVKKYVIVVTKNGNTNNYLSSLTVSEGTLKQSESDEETFNKEIQNYKVTVPYEVDKITVDGTVEVVSASTTDFKEYNLNVGKNDIKISVLSESGSIRVYNIEVTRAANNSALLKNIKVKNYDLDPEFASDTFEYLVNVDNEILQLELEIIPEAEGAEWNIIGNDVVGGFEVGINEVQIVVTPPDGDTTKNETYTLYVNRNLSSNNYLSDLQVSGQTLDPAFDPQKQNYKVIVDRDVNTVTISATAEDSSSQITEGIGEHTLALGENEIKVKVKSSMGVYRTYTVTVDRQRSTNNFLLNLEVLYKQAPLDFDSSFDKEDNEYIINVDSDVALIEIVAEKQDSRATLTGPGMKTLKSGENKFEITVTSEAGVPNVYTVILNKEVSTKKRLLSLTPSAGTLKQTTDPEKGFDKDWETYDLELEQNEVLLGFEYEKESPLATVSGTDTIGVPEGESTRVITVTAEDKSTKTYTINIKRKSESEARLESLSLEGYEFEFDSNTFTYNIRVSKSKKVITEEEITAIAMDAENATVNKMAELTLLEDNINIYIIEVIAKDGITTQSYTLNITRDSEEYSLTSNIYDIVRNDTEDYVIGILPSTNDATFKGNFANEITMLHVYKETTELEDGKLVATEMIVKLESEDYVYDVLRIIVRGDLTKDGKVDITDQVKLINYVGKAITFNRNEMLAGDLTFDGRVDITDQVKLINYVGKAITSINPIKVTSD